MKFKIDRLTLTTNYLYEMLSFCTELLEVNILSQNENKASFQYNDLRIELLRYSDKKKRNQPYEFMSLEMEKEALISLKDSFELFVYRHQKFQKLFQYQFHDIKLKKKLILEITDPDNRIWKLFSNH
ncbi:MAG: hypothetical protein H6621_01485 [Halobacteriovoraceae bacterium]|nr:hypothetical protein [Halobacteriovoraceae bacterium]